MELNLNLSDAILTLALKNGTFCSAFSGFIVFGSISKNCFKNSEYFLFERKFYYLFFTTLLNIAKAISGQLNDKTGTICAKDHVTYIWTLKDDDSINFCLQKEQVVTYSINFTLTDINDFTMVIQKLIAPSLHLKFQEALLLELSSKCTITEIEAFKSKDNCKSFITKHFDVNECTLECYCVLIIHYRDIIMLLHKLYSLTCIEENESYLNLIKN